MVQNYTWYHLNKIGYKKQLEVRVPHKLTQQTLWTEFLSANCCWIVERFNQICSAWLLVIRSESLKWITSSEKGHGRIAVSRWKRWSSQDWRWGRFCYVFGMIRVSSTMSSFPTTNSNGKPFESVLCLSMANNFAGEKYNSREASKNRLSQCLYGCGMNIMNNEKKR